MTGEELYRKFLDGDKKAFDEIIRLYHDGLVYFLYGITQNYDDAQDAAADAFVELLVHSRRYSFRSSLKSYIFSIGRHKAVDIVRKRARQKKKEEYTLTAAILPSPEATVINNEEKQMLKKALNEINETYSQVLHLVYFENLSVDEAAKVMGKSKKSTENCLYRGKIALRQIYEKNYGVGMSEFINTSDLLMKP